MVSSTPTSFELSWQEQASQLMAEGEYGEVISLYERAIADESDVNSHYWHLGLAYLLQGCEEEAQVTWMSVMVNGTPEEVEEWTKELVQVLNLEAIRQTELSNYNLAWLIRQHLKEIVPTDINNILHLIQIAINTSNYIPEHLTNWQVAIILQESISEDVDLDLLLQVIQKLLRFPSPEVLIFIEASVPLFVDDNVGIFIKTLMDAAVAMAYNNNTNHSNFAISVAELCLKLQPTHLEILRQLSCFYSHVGLHQKALETAQCFYDICQTSLWKVQGSYLILRALFTSGSWLEIEPVAQLHKALVKEFVQNPPENIESDVAIHLLSLNFVLPYFQDCPQENRWLQNQVALLCQQSFQAAYPALVKLPYSNQLKATRPLKIGYIARDTHLKIHPVGWLSRWLFQYYDRNSFQVHLYLLYHNLEEDRWFNDKVDFVHKCGCEAQEIAAKIKEDRIDILVDLDSLTLDVTCKVMALKPAPVQVTWLGWDASGIPAIDYFIADPYVLPETAQDDYSESIWRLPHTYVAVDGFEVGVPTLRREQLNIPADAAIYLTAQKGYKRHPNTVRLQMQILKQVPNSYLLIKRVADQAIVQEFFTQIATSEGVNPERLRFLPIDPNEFVHRANLSIADVVLDTYPYSGATTTLETLWMGIPLVTRVGEQFSARNSYGFMMNVGVTEGIAWTDEEYVEWGVRLGKDASLRQQVSWKMRQSRQTSPLWNAKQFTQEMEKAYQQMWQRYSCLSVSTS